MSSTPAHAVVDIVAKASQVDAIRPQLSFVRMERAPSIHGDLACVNVNRKKYTTGADDSESGE
jgi:hypothetical protein